MALPKEPRQKMINIMYLVLTAILALNVSAEVINAFKVVDRSLVTSNTSLAASNNTLYKSLNDKLNDPKQNQETVKYWNDKAVPVSYTHLDVYKRQFLRLTIAFLAGKKLMLKRLFTSLRFLIIRLRLIIVTLLFHVLHLFLSNKFRYILIRFAG